MSKEPKCGVDFCHSCRDCLACYGEDTCFNAKDGKHIWVKEDDDGDKQAIACPECERLRGVLREIQAYPPAASSQWLYGLVTEALNNE